MYDHQAERAGEKAANAPAAGRREHVTGSPQVRAMLDLQRTLGNAAVIQRRMAVESDEQREADAQAAAVRNALSKPGKPLDPEFQAEAEARTGKDFSGRVVHDDAAAHEAAISVQAHAFATDNHVVFANGQYDTKSDRGKRVVLEELIHTDQQAKGPVSGTVQDNGLKLSDPTDRDERAATREVTEAMGKPAPVQRSADPGRAPDAAGHPRESAASAIQRRISLQDPRSSSTRELGSAADLNDFLRRYGVSVFEVFGERNNLSTLRAASFAGFKVDPVMDRMVTDGQDRVFEDSEDGARRLAEAICDEIGEPPRELAGGPAQFGASGAGASNRTLYDIAPALSGRLFGADSGSGRSTEQSGGGPGGIADRLSQRATEELSQRTPENPLLKGAKGGVTGALTGRAEALGRTPQAPGKSADMALWGLWLLENGETRVGTIVNKLAEQASPEEKEKLLRSYNTFVSNTMTEAAASAAASAGTGAGLSRVAAMIPHPVVKGAAMAASAITGAVAAGNKLGDTYDEINKFKTEHPVAFAAIEAARDQDLKQRSLKNSSIVKDVWSQLEWG